MEEQGPKKFWEYLEQTRRIDQTTGKKESLRRWADRLGVDINNLIHWQRGGQVSPRLIATIVKRLKLPEDRYYELIQIANEDAPRYIGAVVIPSFHLKKVRVFDSLFELLELDQKAEFPIPKAFLSFDSRAYVALIGSDNSSLNPNFVDVFIVNINNRLEKEDEGIYLCCVKKEQQYRVEIENVIKTQGKTILEQKGRDGRERGVIVLGKVESVISLPRGGLNGAANKM